MNLDKQNNRRYCSYKGCSSDRLKTRDGAISFFSFPVKDTERCSVWISNCGREEFRYLTPRELGEKRICEFHFDRKMFSNDFKTHLLRNAIPKNCDSAPELIQIDDDDDEASNECEIGIVSEGSNIINNTTINSHTDQDADSPLENGISRLSSTTGSILHTALVNGDNDLTEENQRELTVEHLSSEKQSTQVTSTVKTVNRSSNLNLGSASRANTKFHNLPPQTPQTDFYYQQCPSAEETNNSFPEPPDGELPLFVQQNSIVSLAEDPEPANSEVSIPVSRKRKRNSDHDDLADQVKDAMKHLKNITSLLTNPEDEFDLFGKSVALQMKKMSLCTALTVQAKIQQLLSQYRISDIRKNTQEKTVIDSGEEVKQVSEKVSEEEIEQPSSPQLSLTCASEASDNETTELG